MTKKKLREKYLTLRKDLPDAAIESLSFQLAAILCIALPKKVNTLHIYLPIEKHKEIDTWAIIDKLRELKPSIRIVVPSMNKDLSITNLLLEKDAEISIKPFAIPEPKHRIEIETNEIQCAIVPLLIFDKKGYRVGYGKGIYDRFLATLEPNTLLIGLSLFEPIDEITDIHTYDIPLNLCLTPKSTFSF